MLVLQNLRDQVVILKVLIYYFPLQSHFLNNSQYLCKKEQFAKHVFFTLYSH